MISVIVPVYNVEEYVGKCIESIVNQTFKDIEIIIINDGSSDKSGQICLEWTQKDERIILIDKSNEGQGVARNIGLNIAKGEFVTFVDADDWLELIAIEKMYDAMINNDVDIVTCDLFYVEENENKSGYFQVPSRLRIKPCEIIYTSENTQLINTARMFLWGKLYKRKNLLSSDLVQPNHAFEDTAIIPLIIAKSSNIYHLPYCLYNYLRNRNGSTVNSGNSLKYMIKSLECIRDRFMENNLFDIYYNELKKLSLSQVRFVFKKAEELSGLRDTYKFHKEIEELYLFMNTTYPEWFNIQKYNLWIIGSSFLRKTIDNITFSHKKVKYYIEPYIHIQNIEDVDFIFIDFINENIFVDINAWEQNINKLIEFLCTTSKTIKIILIETYLQESNNNETNLKKINDILRYKYNSLKKKNTNIICINNIYVNIDENIITNLSNLNEGLSWDTSEKVMQVLENL